MDKTPIQNEMPDVVSSAYTLLLEHRIVEITKPIHWNLGEGNPGWVFECIATVPYPNQEKIPCEVPLQILIPEAFPSEPVGITSLSEQVSGFPHQDAESRQLCLREEYLAPRGPQRLVCYVKWAIEWLEDAANGLLLKPGDPYELPDFSRKLLKSPLPTNSPLIFEESSNSYKNWEAHIGKFGAVECFWGAGIPAIFAVKFCHEDGSLIRESDFAPDILKKDSKIDGKWILVSDICYERHRPPQTYKEARRDMFKECFGLLRNSQRGMES